MYYDTGKSFNKKCQILLQVVLKKLCTYTTLRLFATKKHPKFVYYFRVGSRSFEKAKINLIKPEESKIYRSI